MKSAFFALALVGLSSALPGYSSVSLAQIQPVQKSAPAPVVQPVQPLRYQEPPALVVADSSRGHREGKTILLTGQPIGIGPIPGPSVTQGVSAGIYLGPNSILSTDFIIALDDSSSTSYKRNLSSFGVFFKQFVGNSFYIKPGIEHRWVKSAYSYDSFTGNYDEEWSVKGMFTGLTFKIGNQWQFESFTLGCDWVGITQPLFHNTTERTITADGFGSASRSLVDEEEDILEKVSVSLVHFYLGMSF